MGKHDERVRDALEDFRACSVVTSYSVSFGSRRYEADVSEAKRIFLEALRHAVIMQEANTWHGAGGAGGGRG